MTLIIGIFTRDKDDNKEILFASDGLAVTYKDNKKIAQDEDVEKIRKLSPKICIGYAGKNAELFEDVFDELKMRTPKKIKRELEAFVVRLREIIIKNLQKKKHREIETELRQRNQLFQKFIVVGVFHNKLMLIRAQPDDDYKISVEEVAPALYDIHPLVAGSTVKIQNETMAILKRQLELIRSNDEIENIIRYTIFEIAERHPTEINKRVFIRRLSRNFDS